MSDIFEITIEKFSLPNKKDEINPYMTGKLVRKKYESSGHRIFQCQDFENNLLVWFIKKYRNLDKYTKVKIGEYKKNSKTDDYNKEVLRILDEDKIEKLLFLCRICSYLGDPSFPDFIIYGKNEPELKYVYTGDEILENKLFFILLAKKLLDLKISFSSLDFTDFSRPENIKYYENEIIQNCLNKISKRLDMESAETLLDLRFLKTWSVDSWKDLESSYKLFIEFSGRPNKLKEMLSKTENLKLLSEIENKPKPEKLSVLNKTLGINMLEANDLLNLYNIVRS